MSSGRANAHQVIRTTVTEADRAWILFAFALGTGIEMWTGTGINLILPDLSGGLSTSADEASWLLTAYTSSFAIGLSLSHRLAGIFGNRRYLVLAALLYAVASAGCLAGSDLATLLLFRILQGLAGGAFLVRTLVFITHDYEPSQRSMALGLYGLGMYTLSRIAAPILSGYFTDHFTWRLLFIPGTVLMPVVAWIFHAHADRQFEDEAHMPHPDWLGVALLVAGVAALQAMISRGEIDDWFGSPHIVALAIIAFVAHAGFLIWQWAPENEHPLLDLHHLRIRSLLAATGMALLIGMLLGGSLYVLPQYLRRTETHSALQAGCLMSIYGIPATALLSGAAVLAKVVRWMGARKFLALSLLVQAASMFLFVEILTSDTADEHLWAPLLLHGTFVGMVVPGLSLAVFPHIPERIASNARVLYYGGRQFGISLGVTLAAVLLDRRMSLHAARLADAMVNRNTGIVANYSETPLITIRGLLKVQSQVLSFQDIFFVMGCIALATIVLIPLLPDAIESKNL